MNSRFGFADLCFLGDNLLRDLHLLGGARGLLLIRLDITLSAHITFASGQFTSNWLEGPITNECGSESTPSVDF